jgi:hypothetical protein
MCQPGAQFQALSHRGGKTPSLMFMARMALGVCSILNIPTRCRRIAYFENGSLIRERRSASLGVMLLTSQ